MGGANIANFSFFRSTITRFFLNLSFKELVLYHFELQMAGVILLTAMAVGGISLWIKRRRERQQLESASDKDEFSNF